MKRQLGNTVVLLIVTALMASGQDRFPSSKHNHAAGKELRASIAQPTGSAAPNDFVIGNGDVLAINVWKEPDVSRTLPVRPDGKVSLPLIGDIQASGLTAGQLQANLEKALRAYITDPPVTVIVQEVKSQTFNVLGDVQHPGAYALTKPTTVLDAIALSGGFREWAKQTKIYVLRARAGGNPERIAFNYKEVIKGGNLSQNIQLKSGDTVVVP